MNRERMADLADIIENDRLPNVRFDMREVVAPGLTFHPKCGATACIAGYALCAAYGNQRAKSEFAWWDDAKREAARMLGLGRVQAKALFEPRELELYGGDILPKTRKQAADVLRHAAKTGKIDWSVA